MLKIYSLKLILAGLIWWPLTACALPDNLDKSPRLISSEIETEFLVVNKTLQVVRGDQPTINTDNIHLLSTLKSKQIFINEYDYSVTVSRRKYSTKTENPLELFDYSVRFPNLNKSLINEFPPLANNEFIEARIPFLKQPTACYIFTSKVKLHLMCRYGLTRNDEIPEIISRTKNEEM
jgi:hypothetical protein